MKPTLSTPLLLLLAGLPPVAQANTDGAGAPRVAETREPARSTGMRPYRVAFAYDDDQIAPPKHGDGHASQHLALQSRRSGQPQPSVPDHARK